MCNLERGLTGWAGLAIRYDVFARGARFFDLSPAALLPEDAGLEGVGEFIGCSWAVGITSLGGSEVSCVWLALLAVMVACDGEGVCPRRKEPRMESGIWVRKEPFLAGEGSRCGDDDS